MRQYNVKEIQTCIVKVANSLSGREQEIILDLLFEYLRFSFNEFLYSGSSKNNTIYQQGEKI